MKTLILFLAVALPLFSALSTHAADTSCDLNKSACVRLISPDNIKVTFDIAPKPVEFMKELRYTISLAKEGLPITDANVEMDLNMPGMFMGRNKPEIRHIGAGTYEGKGIIPRCPSGRKGWRADIVIKIGNSSHKTAFDFEGK